MHATDRFATSIHTDLALAALRLTTGAIFAAHGAQKLFVYGFDGVSGAFGGMNIFAPGITGPLTGLVEFFGGLALVFGLLTRLAGFGLAIVMLGAITLVHAANGFFAPTGIEFPLALLGANTALALAGAGRFSLDSLIARRRGATEKTDRPARTLDRAA
ncbi:MAG TPA: DoxX family protein [Gemmatimonadaceae bacterium]|nr:DoxX family protein [Gemmatimonadaceae bacterium]